MAQNQRTRGGGARIPPGRPVAPVRRGRRVARKLAQSTLLAAGLLATQFSIPEVDPRFHMFDRSLMDRLHAPITRYHE